MFTKYTELKEVRCFFCGKLLARASSGTVEIKCPRCKKITEYKAVLEYNEEMQTIMIGDSSGGYATMDDVDTEALEALNGASRHANSLRFRN